MPIITDISDAPIITDISDISDSGRHMSSIGSGLTGNSELSEFSDNCDDLFFSDTGPQYQREGPLHSTRCDHSTEVQQRPELQEAAISPIRPAEPMGGKHVQVGPFEYADTIKNKWPSPSHEANSTAATHMNIYAHVRSTNLPNYISAKIPIPSDINCEAWADLLRDYHDAEIMDYLRYGWPGGYTDPDPPRPSSINHPSATAHSNQVSKFIHKELQKGALLGPFSKPPFHPWNQTSPLMTRPKKQSQDRRVIIDLSFPSGYSVNDGVSKNVFQGQPFTYTFPTLEDMVQAIRINGRGSYLWKADLERAYRQLRNDPLDYPLMGIHHDGQYFIDICPSFGSRGSSAAQQRVSEAVCFMMGDIGHSVLAYVDDFCGSHRNFHQAMTAFADFEALCEHLGLKLAPEKSTFPTTSLEWLGFRLSTVDMMVTIPKEKLQEIHDLCVVWLTKARTSRRDLQSLAGKLNHVSQCILGARRFMGRILQTLRRAPRVGTVKLEDDLRADIRWFLRYAQTSNGIFMIEPQLRVFEVQCDACPKGAGGFSEKNYYSVEFPQEAAQEYHINQLEAANIVLAVKTLLPIDVRNIELRITTDNMVAMQTLNTGRTRDPFLAACSRELWLIAATRQLRIVVNHAPGVTLILADALSRWHHSPDHVPIANHFIQKLKLHSVAPVNFADIISHDL